MRQQPAQRDRHRRKIRIAQLVAQPATDVCVEIETTLFDEPQDTDGDDEFLCYSLGLPYGYFKKEMA